MVLAFWMTWKLVTTWPCWSQMKPEPVPWGISVTLRPNMSPLRATLVTKTTEGEAFSKS